LSHFFSNILYKLDMLLRWYSNGCYSNTVGSGERGSILSEIELEDWLGCFIVHGQS
jgi:hypothetical protein